jgi:hypothetical protein
MSPVSPKEKGKETSSSMTKETENIKFITSLYKLDGDEFMLWKIKIKMYLKERGLWNCTQEKELKDKENNEKAVFALCASVHDRDLLSISRSNSAYEIWDFLCSKYESKSTHRILAEKDALEKLKMEKGTTVQEFIDKLNKQFLKLENLGAAISEKEQIVLLIRGFPARFQPFVFPLKLRLDETGLSFNQVQEVVKLAELEIGTPSVSIETNATKVNFQCYFCQSPDHMKREFPKYLAWKKRKEEKANKVAKGLYLDSGANAHVVGDATLVKDLQRLKNEIPVHTPDGTVSYATGKGKMKLGQESASVELGDVYVVPGFKKNLVSLGALQNQQIDVKLQENGFNVILDGKTIPLAKRTLDNLYEIPNDLIVNSTEIKDQDMLLLWHRRFGHLNESDLKKTLKGMGISISSSLPNCEVCALGKQARDPFPTSQTKLDHPLAIVSSDICGPFPSSGSKGLRYIVTFVDGYSRFVVVYSVSEKSALFDCFKLFLAQLERQTGFALKVLRSDNGGEYISNRLKDFCREKGIIQQFSTIYSPQKNGIAERMNRTLVEYCRCMLFDAKLDETFWPQAIQTAAYIRNRSPNSFLTGITPYEKLIGKAPDLQHVHVFGSLAMVKIPDEKRKKLDEKSRKCIFLGYSDSRKAWKFLDPETQEQFESRDANFFETTRLAKECQLVDNDDMNVPPLSVINLESEPIQSSDDHSRINTEMPEVSSRVASEDDYIDNEDSFETESHSSEEDAIEEINTDSETPVFDIEPVGDAVTSESAEEVPSSAEIVEDLSAMGHLAQTTRRSTRNRKPPVSYWLNQVSINCEIVPQPANLKEALTSKYARQWRAAACLSQVRNLVYNNKRLITC